MQNWQSYFFKVKGIVTIYHRWFLLLLAIGIFGLGYWQGMEADKKEHLRQGRSVFQLRQKGDYRFINPLLECENFSEGNFLRSKDLEAGIEEILEKVSHDSDIGHLSVYFRDLNNGPWMGFNEDEKFTPASLLKVPIMMAYFKKAEDDSSYLDKELVYGKNLSGEEFTPNIKSGIKLENGKKYSIKDLIEFMIVFSDNEATRLLIENIDLVFLEKVYRDLMIPIPGESSSSDNFMTVKEYASFFRILYNASYLSRELSERALELLSKSSFKDGLVAGVPENIMISHKFGERVVGDMVQLHDCGIIYNEEKPYLLCVMTRGKNFSKSEWLIEKVSEKVWEKTQKK
jgi:beta-lactamase class A